MKKITIKVNLKNNNYPIVISNHLLKNAGTEIKKIIPKAQKFLLITDKNIPKSYARIILSSLKSNKKYLLTLSVEKMREEIRRLTSKRQKPTGESVLEASSQGRSKPTAPGRQDKASDHALGDLGRFVKVYQQFYFKMHAALAAGGLRVSAADIHNQIGEMLQSLFGLSAQDVRKIFEFWLAQVRTPRRDEGEESPLAMPRLSFDERIKFGGGLHGIGDVRGAIAVFTDLLSEDLESQQISRSAVLFNRAVANANAKNLTQALEDVNEAIELEERNPSAQATSGFQQAYRLRDDLQKAMK